MIGIIMCIYRRKSEPVIKNILELFRSKQKLIFVLYTDTNYYT